MSPAPRRLNLKIAKGATLREMRRWSVGPTYETRVPVDFTGATAEAMFRRDYDSPEVLWRLSTDNGGVTLGPDGWITLYIRYQDTETFKTWDEAVWDLEILFPNGDKRRLFAGTVTVSPEATHA